LEKQRFALYFFPLGECPHGTKRDRERKKKRRGERGGHLLSYFFVGEALDERRRGGEVGKTKKNCLRTVSPSYGNVGGVTDKRGGKKKGKKGKLHQTCRFFAFVFTFHYEGGRFAEKRKKEKEERGKKKKERVVADGHHPPFSLIVFL